MPLKVFFLMSGCIIGSGVFILLLQFIDSLIKG
jgi:hypothetical protein